MEPYHTIFIQALDLNLASFWLVIYCLFNVSNFQYIREECTILITTTKAFFTFKMASYFCKHFHIYFLCYLYHLSASLHFTPLFLLLVLLNSAYSAHWFLLHSLAVHFSLFLLKGSGNIFYQGPDNTYFRLFKSHQMVYVTNLQLRL